jgi:hypothetical protein
VNGDISVATLREAIAHDRPIGPDDLRRAAPVLARLVDDLKTAWNVRR